MTNENKEDTLNKKNLDALKQAAKQRVIPSVNTRLEEGETFWLRGRPVESDKGLISIEMANNIIITLGESEILECKQHEEQFFIRVKRGASVVMRQEATLSIEPLRPKKQCDCDNTGEVTTRSSLSKNFSMGSIGGMNALDPDICVICDWVWVDSICSIPGTDFKVRCLELVLICTNICRPA